jgi:hypothetical protein
MSNTTGGEDVVPDTPMNEYIFEVELMICLLPFIIIPLCIIAYRFVKYLYRLREARKYGYGKHHYLSRG